MESTTMVMPKLSRSSSWISNWLSQLKIKKTPTSKTQWTKDLESSLRPIIIASEEKEVQKTTVIPYIETSLSPQEVSDTHMGSDLWNKIYIKQERRSSTHSVLPQSNLPHNDKKERWTIKHELITLAVDGLFSNPDKVTQLSCLTEKHVLQVGCGNSAWGIDLANRYPRWIVIGLDDLNNESLPRRVPKNFNYMECTNVLQQLKKIPSKTFDMINCRLLMFSVTFDEYKQVMHECLRLLKPGCYLEFMELDLRIYYQNLVSNPVVTSKLNHRIMENMELKSLDPRLARRLQDLVDSKAQTMESKYISLPLGVWGGKLGVMFRDDLHDLIETLLNDQEQQVNMDKELDLNGAFMNLHSVIIQS